MNDIYNKILNKMKKQIISEEFRRMQKLAGIITKSQLNEGVKEINQQNMYSVKEPNSAVLANGEKLSPLSDEECKLVKDFSEKENVKKLRPYIKLSPPDDPMCVLSLENKKMEKRIIRFFKSTLLPDGSESKTPKYYITVLGPGETSYSREKYYTADNISEFQELIQKTLEEFSSWCDEQIKLNLIRS